MYLATGVPFGVGKTLNYYSIDTSKLGIDLSQINQGDQVQAGDWLLFGFLHQRQRLCLGHRF